MFINILVVNHPVTFDSNEKIDDLLNNLVFEYIFVDHSIEQSLRVFVPGIEIWESFTLFVYKSFKKSL
jgi:hypothetical protein